MVFPETVFRFKHFEVRQDKATMKIGTDGVMLGAWADVKSNDEILDIGTGTGLIALMLAQRSQQASVHAVEIEQEAFEQASENFDLCLWHDRLRCFNMSIQDFAEATSQKYDLIVCNPPFFTGGTLSDNHERSLVRHTIKLPHGDLLLSVRKLLKKNGRFCVILPYLEGLRFKEMAQSNGLFCNKVLGTKPSLLKPVERLLMEFSYLANQYEYKELTIRNERQEWSSEYINLTKEFYINL
ncbi:MAG: methyltransferase [Saprospiraceae bacterium]|nr:methyltransferase [Saprospiraceae bacterium]